MIKKKYIGKTFSKRVPNGCLITQVIEDNPKKYELYKLMGLDIFENKKKVSDTKEGNK